MAASLNGLLISSDSLLPASHHITHQHRYYYGQMDQGWCHNYYPNHMDFGTILPNGTQNMSEIPIPANAKASKTSCGTDFLQCRWSGDLWTEEATYFIEQSNTPASQPWYLYLAYTAPHAGDVGDNGEG